MYNRNNEWIAYKGAVFLLHGIHQVRERSMKIVTSRCLCLFTFLPYLSCVHLFKIAINKWKRPNTSNVSLNLLPALTCTWNVFVVSSRSRTLTVIIREESFLLAASQHSRSSPFDSPAVLVSTLQPLLLPPKAENRSESQEKTGLIDC